MLSVGESAADFALAWSPGRRGGAALAPRRDQETTGKMRGLVEPHRRGNDVMPRGLCRNNEP
jgi:hypothetical protein